MIRVPKFCLAIFVVGLVLGLTLPALAAEAKGKIKSVDGLKFELVVTDTSAKDWSFQVNRDAKVFLNDEASTLADLKAGDEATVTYTKEGEKMNASEIRVTRRA